MKTILQVTAKNSRLLVLGALLILLLFPLFVSNAYVLRVATTSLIYVILTLGLNVVAGYSRPPLARRPSGGLAPMRALSCPHASAWEPGCCSSSPPCSQVPLRCCWACVYSS